MRFIRDGSGVIITCLYPAIGRFGRNRAGEQDYRTPGAGPMLGQAPSPPSAPSPERLQWPLREDRMTQDPARRRSAALVDGLGRAAARAMLKAVGLTDDD